MSKSVTPPTHTAVAVRIVWPMNDHGAMTVRVEAENEVRQVVECESTTVRETLERLPEGTTVPLKMKSVGTRGNAWRAVELVGESETRDTAASRTESRAEKKYAPDDETSEQRETVQA